MDFTTKRWSDLLLSRKIGNLLSETDMFLNSLQHSHSITRDTLSNFYYSFLQTLFSCMEISNADALPLFQKQISQFSVREDLLLRSEPAGMGQRSAGTI